MFIFAFLVVFKLSKIQFVQGEAYRSLAEKRSIKNVVIPANRGNVYSVDGSLLATSYIKRHFIKFSRFLKKSSPNSFSTISAASLSSRRFSFLYNCTLARCISINFLT